MLKINKETAPKISAMASHFIRLSGMFSNPVTPLAGNRDLGVASLIVPVKRKISPKITCKAVNAMVISIVF
jgi:hypothetical protein